MNENKKKVIKEFGAYHRSSPVHITDSCTDIKETKSATVNIFRKKNFLPFSIIFKSRIMLSFHNKSAHCS